MERPTNSEISDQTFHDKFYSIGVDDQVQDTFYKDKFDHIQKESQETAKDKPDELNSGRKPRRPTLMGVAAKVIKGIEKSMDESPRVVPTKNPNPALAYYSTNRQSRLGEYSDLLSRFQKVIMRNSHIK